MRKVSRPARSRVGFTIALLAVGYALFAAGPAEAGNLGLPGAVLGSARQPPQIRGIHVRKVGRKAVRLRVRVTYPSALSDGTSADVAVVVWRNPNHHGKVGTVDREFPLSGGSSDSFTRTHRLRIGGKPGRRLNRALRRKGSAAGLATVSVTQSRLPGSDGTPQSVVDSSKQLGGNGTGKRLRAGRQYGFSVYNASSRPVKLSALPVDCVLNDGAAGSNVSAVTGTRLDPGQTYTVYAAANRGGSKAKNTTLPMSRSRSLWFDLQTLQAAAANDRLWGKAKGRSLAYGHQVSALPKHGGCKKARNGDFAIAADTSDGEHDEAYLTVHRHRISGSTLPGGHGVQISTAKTDGGQAVVTVANDPPDPKECTNQPSDTPWMWMTCMDQNGPPGWKDLPLNRMALPASHDAQTAGLSQDRDWPAAHGPSHYEHCGAWDPSFNLVHGEVIDQATTQTRSLYDQLDMGVRVLDVRFAYPSKLYLHRGAYRIEENWWPTHSAQVSIPMEQQLQQVVDWARAHPKELVVLNLSLCSDQAPHVNDREASDAAQALHIPDRGGLCAVSGNYPSQPGDIRPESVQPGHNVDVYLSTSNNDASMGRGSKFAHDAEDNCGWHWDDGQIGAAYREANGAQLCAPSWAIHQLFNVAPATQETLRNQANQGIQDLRQEFSNFNMPWRYEFSSQLEGMQMIWTVAGETGLAAYRGTFGVCPQNNIENNDLLRGGVGKVQYEDSNGIQNRQDLYNEFSPSAGVFMVDDIDRDFAKQVIALNAQRARDPVSYTGLRGWAVNASNLHCLDLTGGNPQPGTLFQTYACNDTASQRFTLTESGELHVQRDDSQCLESQAGRLQNGRVVSLQRCSGLDAQRWTLDANGRISGIGGDCMSGVGFTSIPMRSCDASAQQKWNLVGTLKSTPTGRCLTLPTVATGTYLSLQDCRQADDMQVFARTAQSRLEIKGICVQGGPPGTSVTTAPCASSGANGADAQTWETSQGEWKLPSEHACLGTYGSGPEAQMVACTGQGPWRLEGY